ncbi:hypothetical protein SNEBB_010466 [Seison nebaliae]|nr:hypothetical protein SNEBB_010466 [Seison nebaliae]
MDIKNKEDLKDYLNRLKIEYGFQCDEEKKADGCQRLANYYENVERNDKKAAEIMKKNCDELDYPHSCYTFANRLMNGKGVDIDISTALQYHEKACGHNFPQSCHSAALLHQVGYKDYSEKNEAKAIDLYRKACQLEVPDSCFRLFGMYFKKANHLRKNEELKKQMESVNVISENETSHQLDREALTAAKTGCHLGNIYCCINAAKMLREGRGTTNGEKEKGNAEKFTKLAKEIKEQVIDTKPNMVFGELHKDLL